MGQIESILNLETQKPQQSGNQDHAFSNKVSVTLEVDFEQPLLPSLLQLKSWSFSQIRAMYNTLRNLSKYPFIDKPTFKHVLGFKSKTSNFIFDRFGNKSSTYRV